MADHADRVIAGKYRLHSVLGKGGMGIVYRAAQLDVEAQTLREVALKMIRADVAADLGDAVVRRFLREVRAVARLRNPHVIMVHDVGQTEHGELYFVMELVDGPTLKDLIQPPGKDSEPLSLSHEQAVTIGSQICEALAEAHGLPEPIVHRDLKPANVFVERWPADPWVKVGDFGIAKVLSEETSGLTATGSSPGTPLYMSPEQWKGGKVDGRSDLYALGAVLYQLLTGHPPFQGDPMTLMYKHLHDAPPPLPAGVSAPLQQLVERLLAKDPASRPATAREARSALQAALQPHVAVDPQAGRERTPTSEAVTVEPRPSPLFAPTAAEIAVAEDAAVPTPEMPERLRRRRSFRLPIVLGSLAIAIGVGTVLVLREGAPASRQSVAPPVAVQVEESTGADRVVKDALAVAQFFLDRGEYDSAIEELEKGIKRVPGNQALRRALDSAAKAKAAENEVLGSSG